MEDYERINLMEMCYLREKEEELWLWWQEELAKEQPAKIIVEHEGNNINSTFQSPPEERDFSK